MRRRDFIKGIGGSAVAARPFIARAQQPAMPVIGFIRDGSADARYVAGFRKGLSETGYVEGQNLTVEYHWLEGKYDRLPELLADLIRQRVAVIATPRTVAAQAAKAATVTIPIVFFVGEDPVELGLIDSMAKPGGNLTGINIQTSEIVTKRLRLLHDLLPNAVRIAVLVHPGNASVTRTTVQEVQKAAPIMGLQTEIINATTVGEINKVFATFEHERPDALFVAADSVFTSRRVQLVTLAASDRIPATYPNRDYVEVGGLMSYGPDFADMFRQVGVYQAGGPAGVAVNQIRVGYQCHDRTGARRHHSRRRVLHRRRGDRMRRREFITAFAFFDGVYWYRRLLCVRQSGRAAAPPRSAVSVVALFPREAIEIRFVLERAVFWLGNLECHFTIADVGPSNGAVEPAEWLCSL